jgi:phage terminase small subunit
MSAINGRKSGRKPAKKTAKKKPARKPTLKQDAFVDHYFTNGGNGTAAARDAGYKGTDHTLAQVAYENLRKPEIASRVRARLDGMAATADEVLFLLGDHLRADLADLADCFKPDGSLDLVAAQQRGVSRLVKKIKTNSREVTHDDGVTERIVTTELELHDAQGAARVLADLHGLKQQPKENETDLKNRREWAETQLQRVMDELALDRPNALEWMRAHTPQAAQWIS